MAARRLTLSAHVPDIWELVFRPGTQKVYLCKKGHNFQPYILSGTILSKLF